MAQGSAKISGNDHGLLSGLSDDDHTQYHNDSRHIDAHSSGRWRLGSAQTISNDSGTTVAFDTLVHEDDADGDISFNTSTGVMTINTSGVYQFAAGSIWVSNGTDFRALVIKHDGGALLANQLQLARSTTPMNLSTIYKVTATETFSVQVKQTSGGNLNLLGEIGTYFAVIKL